MKKEILIPILIVFLGLIFVFINAMVFFTKGNAWLIKKKLKVGAMILSLTGILACGSHFGTCYGPTKEQLEKARQDSIRIWDSIAKIEAEEKRIQDSVAGVTEKRMKDSVARIKHKTKTQIKPVCYRPVKTCYKPVQNPDNKHD